MLPHQRNSGESDGLTHFMAIHGAGNIGPAMTNKDSYAIIRHLS
jgi:hypothetical protein